MDTKAVEDPNLSKPIDGKAKGANSWKLVSYGGRGLDANPSI